jgi:hypothetical protein
MPNVYANCHEMLRVASTACGDDKACTVVHPSSDESCPPHAHLTTCRVAGYSEVAWSCCTTDPEASETVMNHAPVFGSVSFVT